MPWNYVFLALTHQNLPWDILIMLFTIHADPAPHWVYPSLIVIISFSIIDYGLPLTHVTKCLCDNNTKAYKIPITLSITFHLKNIMSTFLQMSWELRYCGMCKMTWLDHQSRNYSNANFHKIQLWAHAPIVKWAWDSALELTGSQSPLKTAGIQQGDYLSTLFLFTRKDSW